MKNVAGDDWKNIEEIGEVRQMLNFKHINNKSHGHVSEVQSEVQSEPVASRREVEILRDMSQVSLQ